MGIEQANTQQISVAANMGATENLGQLLRQEMDKKVGDNQQQNQRLDESALKKALEEGGGKAGQQILQQMAAKLTQNLPTNKLMQSLKDDFNFVLDSQEDNSQDKFSVSSPEYFVSKAGKEKKSGGQTSSGFSGEEQQQAQQQAQQPTRASLKEYLGTYSQFLVTGGSEAKKKVQQGETALIKEKGVSVKELQSLKLQAANSVRSEIMRQVKNSHLKQICSTKNSLEYILNKKEVQSFIDFAFFSENLGGEEFGGYKTNLQTAVNSSSAEVWNEMKDFVAEKLTEELTQKALGKKDEKAVVKDIDELLKLGEKVGFDVANFLQQLPDRSLDLGLLPPGSNNPALAAEAGTGQGDQERPRQYQYTADEEKEIFTDKLRAIYMQRALHGDLRSVIQTQFKMMKMQNGLIKLGVSNFEEVEREGKALARFRLMEMLQEGFEERATYAKLSGEAWGMTEKKLKTVLRNLERLGVVLSSTELDSIRDKANEKMLREAEHELTMINTAIEIRGEIKFLTSKQKMLTEVVGRLSTESGFGRPGDELGLVSEAA
ncbi:MAG: hypothetical protein WC529_08015 [Candidatus Margulisiibacteriota bacterium]